MDEKRFMKKARKYGLPNDAIFHILRAKRILRDPTDFWSRRSEAKAISGTSKHSGFIDEAKGFATFGPSDFEGIREAVAAANEIRERKSLDGKFKKPFFVNLLEPSDLEMHPELLAIARNKAIQDAAAGYLGTVPELSGIGVFLSPKNESLEKSQYFHTDDIDKTQVKCFINCNEIGPDNGPFTFIPADVSDKMRKKLKHGWCGPRFTDQEIETHTTKTDIIAVTGGPGTGVLVDTSRCIHFGSRCREGYRLVIMFQYTRHPNLSFATQRAPGSTLIIDH